MPFFPSRPLRPPHSFSVTRTALRRCLPALCLGLALLFAAPPASAASLHEFVTRWGKTAVSSWPPAEGAGTVPAANGTRSLPGPAAGTPALAAPAVEAARNATAPAPGTHNSTTQPAGAGNATAPAEAGAPRSQPPPAHPTPEARQSATLPDGMPSSLLGNANLHAPMVPPPAQQ